MKNKCVIIEDEPMGIKNLQSLLHRYHPELEVVRTAKSVVEAKEAFSNEDADLFFLDINLLDGSVFSALDDGGYEGKHIVFTTAYEEYGARAFRFPALHYLLKPIDPTELQKAVERYKGKHKQPNNLIENPETQENVFFDKLLLPTHNGIIFVNIKEVVHIQSANKYSIVFTSDNKQLIVSKPLTRFEELLQDKGFLRVHESHIVNIQYITNYIKGKGGELVMSDGNTIPVAPKRKDTLQPLFRLKL